MNLSPSLLPLFRGEVPRASEGKGCTPSFVLPLSRGGEASPNRAADFVVLLYDGLFLRMKIKKKKTIIAVSGGFDPLHVGHVRLFNAAKKLGRKLVVILNNDNWLAAKKGYSFMPERERKEVIEGLRAVDRVVVTAHAPRDPDRSVCRELRKIHPDIFANGGDRDNRDAKKKSSSLNPEQKLCKELGITMVFNVGDGGKVQSSSWLLEKYSRRINGDKQNF